jgi:hypothetical protein
MSVSMSDEQLDQIFARHLATLADEVTVTPRTGFTVARPYPARIGTSGRTVALAGVLVALSLALAASAAIVGQVLNPPQTFPIGSIAFVRSGDLYVAGPDGTGEKLFAAGAGGEQTIPRFAFSPDRTRLAYTRIDPGTGRQEVVIVGADGQVTGTYGGSTSPADPPQATIIGWAPDSQRLAVYPGQSAAEMVITSRDGTPLTSLPLTDVSGASSAWSSLQWSPDGTRIAIPTIGGAQCPDSTDQAVCYELVAADGSGVTALDPSLISGHASPAQLVWASDGGYALAHWGPSDGYPGSLASLEIRPGNPKRGYEIAPLPEYINVAPGRTLAWLRDSSRLAVAAFDSRLGPVFYVFDDGEDSRLPMNPFALTDSIPMVTWSPDGSHLIFATSGSDGSSGIGIWSVDRNGGLPTKLLDADGLTFDVAGSGVGATNPESTSNAVRPS